jgi:23S rRNA (cytosine1962-C5)-methyltransferase
VTDPFACIGTVRLRPGRDAAVRRRHPWVYRGAIADPIPHGGGPVCVAAASGAPLGVALPGGSGGSLALRMVAFGEQVWSAATLRDRLLGAHRLRVSLELDTDAYRLVHAEGDALPGLVIDRYLDVAVCELYEPAWEAYLPALRGTLVEELGIACVLLRRVWQRGTLVDLVHGKVPAAPLVVREGTVQLLADLLHGQKTGLFLDQRENRRRLGACAAGASVLNLFAYSGGFALAALAGGATRAVNVDASAVALALARALGASVRGHHAPVQAQVRAGGRDGPRGLAEGGDDHHLGLPYLENKQQQEDNRDEDDADGENERIAFHGR